MLVKRQSREHARLNPFRRLQPGEVDHEVNRGQLVTPPAPVWDASTLSTCTFLYNRWVRPKTGGLIPDRAFCDLPRWIFMEYLVQFCDVLLFGSNNPSLSRLPPIVLSQNLD